jgi:hypothetical protein
METKYRIYIPSRGRYDTCYTADCLREYNIRFFLVVEPQEAEKYIAKYGTDSVLILPENDRGIAYVRNWMKLHSEAEGQSFHWQIDDNVRKFKIRIDGHNVVAHPYNLLTFVEDYADKFDNIALASLTHVAFAFAQKTDIKFNRNSYMCFLCNNSVDAEFRAGVVVDTDYSMQVLTKGWCTIVFTRLLIDKVGTGKMKGGLAEIEYANGGRRARNLKLCELWNHVFQEEVLKNGKSRIKPSSVWRNFKQRPKLKENAEN